jgi:MFS family permease
MSLEGWHTLRHRDFALTCGARFLVTIAMHMQNVAIGWFIYDVTADAFALGLLGLAGLVPALLLILLTGLAADRIDRRLILIASSMVMTLAGLSLLWHVGGGASVVWPVYLFIILFSGARSFYNPASQALVPNLVPPGQLASAIAFTSGASQAAAITGPALGGLLYALDASLPFAVATACFVLAAGSAIAIRHRSAPPPKEPLSWRSLLAGIEFARSRPVVLGAISLDMVAVMLGSVVALLPIFAKDILDVGPFGLGLLRSAPAVGALLMAASLANRPFVQRHSGARLFQFVAIYGLATLCFGLSENLYLSMACLVVAGAADMVSVVIRHTLVQAETADALRGRVAAVNSLFISTSGELGQLRAGVVAGFFGAVPTVVAGGLAAVGVAYLWARLFPQLRDRDRLVEEKPDPARA